MNTLFAILLSIAPADTATILFDDGAGTVDTTIDEGAQTTNSETSTQVFFGTPGSGDDRKGLVEFPTSEIPEGTLTDMRYIVERFDWGGHDNTSGTATAYAVKQDVDHTDCTWINYDATGPQGWDAIGCSTSGTDYHADGDPPTTAYDGSAPSLPDTDIITIQLDPDWATNWRDSTWTNNGFLLLGDGVTNTGFRMWSADAVGSEPYIEIDYTASGPSLQPGMTLFE